VKDKENQETRDWRFPFQHLLHALPEEVATARATRTEGRCHQLHGPRTRSEGDDDFGMAGLRRRDVEVVLLFQGILPAALSCPSVSPSNGSESGTVLESIGHRCAPRR